MRILQLAFSIGLFFLAGNVRSQVVINVPPAAAAPASISGATTLNLFDDGELNSLVISEGATFNMEGGRVKLHVLAESDGLVEMSGGKIDSTFRAFDGSTVQWSGGRIAEFEPRTGSTVTIHGYDFYIDDSQVAGLANVGDSVNVSVPFAKWFDGVLSDGVPALINSRPPDGQPTLLTLVKVLPPTLSPLVEVANPS